ncbi:MAG: flagellar basal-body rod protein FlgG [Candidatus Accumulibacter sp.]|jgi:flagellar basal-body rod protein FlgG|nr:flagellar basal-body rod protein FlgG [Accumulibacter sp.]
MIRSLWIARTGLDAQQTNLDVIANNLANVSTNGFKRARAVFEDLLYQTLRQPGAQSSQATQIPVGLQLGTGARPVSTARIHTEGAVQQTANDLDLAIDGAGFLEVLLPDGTTAYTRDGSLQRDSEGQVVTASGYVVQPTITIPADATSITIAKDGTVSVTAGNSTATTQIGTLNVTTFINVGGLLSIGENLYLETAASGAPTQNVPGQNGAGALLQYFVETSNVNVAEELVSMIQAQRAFELNSKVVTTSDAMLGRLTQM